MARDLITKEDLEEEIERLVLIAMTINRDSSSWQRVKVTELRSPDAEGVNWTVDYHDGGPAAEHIKAAIETCRQHFNIDDGPRAAVL